MSCRGGVEKRRAEDPSKNPALRVAGREELKGTSCHDADITRQKGRTGNGGVQNTHAERGR